MDHNLPEYEAWNNAAVHLLRGAVYFTNESLWNTILANITPLRDFFAHIGLVLIVAEDDGLAYLRPLEEDEQPEGYENMAKLFHRTQLNYSQTLLCVLLREHLDEFETKEVHDEYCAVDCEGLFEQWKAFGFDAKDEVALNNKFKQSLSKLEKIGFVDKISEDAKLWRVNAILKARLPAEKLENLHIQLQQEIQQRRAKGEISSE